MSDNLVLEPGESVASAARTDAPPAILMDRVNKWFGALRVLRDVSLSVAPGERVVVAGIQLLRPGQKVAVVGGDAP